MNKENKSVLDGLLEEIDPLEAKKTENRMLLAARIDELMQTRRWSKSGFAALMHQQPSVISKWLSGTHNFTQDTLTEIAHVLEVTLEDLFRGKPQELVHRANFAVIQAKYYGGEMTMIMPDLVPAETTFGRLGSLGDWSDHIPDIMLVPHHGSKEWLTLGTCTWVSGKKEVSIRKKADKDDHSIYALKV